MSTVSAEQIKTLRAKTNVSMSKCKEALVESGGNLDGAVEYLRKKGIAQATKKEGREANEGMIAFAENEEGIAVVEVNSETDFVANNATFQSFAKQMAQEALQTLPETLEAFLGQSLSTDLSLTIDQFRATLVQSIGENIQIKRVLAFSKKPNTSYGLYSHMGGKIVTLVTLENDTTAADLARDVAMHVAAASPDFLDPSSVPAQILETERNIAREQVKGKPENIIEKILEGKIKAYYDQVCLVCQKFIKDDAVTISQLLAKHNPEIKISSFIRWTLGNS